MQTKETEHDSSMNVYLRIFIISSKGTYYHSAELSRKYMMINPENTLETLVELLLSNARFIPPPNLTLDSLDFEYTSNNPEQSTIKKPNINYTLNRSHKLKEFIQSIKPDEPTLRIRAVFIHENPLEFRPADDFNKLINRLADARNTPPNSQLFISWGSYNVTDNIAKNIQQQLPLMIDRNKPLIVILIDHAFANDDTDQEQYGENQLYNWYNVSRADYSSKYIRRYCCNRDRINKYTKNKHYPQRQNPESVDSLFHKYDVGLPEYIDIYTVSYTCIFSCDDHTAYINDTDLSVLNSNENLVEIFVTNWSLTDYVQLKGRDERSHCSMRYVPGARMSAQRMKI